MPFVATSLDVLASSWFNSLSKAHTQEWSTFTVNFPKQFDSVTAQYKTQAEAQNVQLNTHDSISIYAGRVEDLVKKDWPEYDAIKRNTDFVIYFIQGSPLT